MCVLLAGCGSSKSSTAADTGASATSGSATQVAAPLDPRLKHKPKVTVPKGKPPSNLVSKDLITGHGPAAGTGDLVSVQYVGVNFKGGKEFDASWKRGQPFQFQIGGGQVIPGWDQGVVGMRVGGRRELIVPPGLGYGPQGQPPTIQPNETLVFVIDLQKIG
jgi:peptidylprolyl isomerase